MPTKTLEKKINNLTSEMARMRSFFISVAGRDAEGEYRPEFIEEILNTADQKPSHARFTTAADFLKRLR